MPRRGRRGPTRPSFSFNFLLASIILCKDNRIYVSYNDLSPELVKALIATEDVRFTKHLERDGRKVLIAARNGVVLACGGCENALDYMQQVATHPKTLPVGSPYNEGDGIRLAQAVGARLWHMNVWESGGAGLAPEDDRTRSVGDPMFFSP